MLHFDCEFSAVQLVKKEMPEKQFSSIAPPHAGHSLELLQYVEKGHKHKLTVQRMEKCLLDDPVCDAAGTPVVYKPEKYKCKR